MMQGVQAEPEVAPKTDENVPAGQGLQTADEFARIVVLYVPAGH